jgi:hypothetical protein
MVFRDAVQRHGCWIVAAIAVVAYYPRFIKDPAGMELYPAAAGCLLRGEMLLKCAVGFTYPPFFALMMTPFVPMPMWFRNAIWYVILIGSIVACLKLSEVLARRIFSGEWTTRELSWFRVLTFVLSLKFILAVLENQAFDVLVLLFVLIGLLGLVVDRWLVAGAGFALAAALKTTPLIFLPYLLVKRRFMEATAFIAVFGFTSMLPDLLVPSNQSGYLVTWLEQVGLGPFLAEKVTIEFNFWSGPNLLNQSLRGAVARIISESSQHQQFVVILVVTLALFILCVAALMLKSRRSDQFIPIDGALLLISMLMLSPMTSRSHYIALILPYSILTAALVRDYSARRVGAFVLTASFVLATGTYNDLAGQYLSELAARYDLPTMGALVLIVYLGVLIWSRQYLEETRSVCQTTSDGNDMGQAAPTMANLSMATSQIASRAVPRHGAHMRGSANPFGGLGPLPIQYVRYWHSRHRRATRKCPLLGVKRT